MKITKDSDHYLIRFSYDVGLVDELRQFHKAKWNPDKKCWRVPINERNNYALAYLQGYRHSFPDSIGVFNFQRGLFKHQKEGVDFALSRRRCILAFEMGLGKTLTTIEIMERSGLSNWWLVAPFGAQMEWLRQLKSWKAEIYPSIITTYESLHKHLTEQAQPPDGVIFDESVKIKNPNSQRSHYASELCRIMRTNKQSYILLLSGSPAPKEPTDWWHQLECIFPGWIREGDKHKFINRYAITEEKDYGYGKFKEITGWDERQVKLLGKRIAPLVLVKQKKDCFDLPDKIFDPIECNPSKETLQVAKFLANNSEHPLEKLRELSDGFQYQDDKTLWVGSNKLNIIKQFLDQYHTDNEGPGRLIIFAAFRASINKLREFVREHNWEADYIDGRGMSNTRCLDIFDSSDDSNYCLVCHPACVYGLNFARTQVLVYYSNSFNPDHRIQSLDRRDRPGMNINIATRVVDLINLPTDQLVLDRITQRLSVQSITIEEIKKCLR